MSHMILIQPVINPFHVMNNLFIWDQLEKGRIFNMECAVKGKLTLSDSYIAFHHVLEISTRYRDRQLFI